MSADRTQITVSWTEPNNRGSNIANYKIYWDAGAGGLPRTLLTTTANTVFNASTNLLFQDLVDGGSYQFAVVALNAIGASDFSNASTFIAATVPFAPPSL